MRDPGHRRNKAFELRRRAIDARAGAARPIEVAPEPEAETSALEHEAQRARQGPSA
jgi:hypothetical protein